MAAENALRRHLALSIAFVAAAMLMVEILLTRIFSVLFFYHYSFFAVSLVMSGLTLGGLLASRWNVPRLSAEALSSRLSALALVFSVGTLGGLAYVAFAPNLAAFWVPDLVTGPSSASIGVATPVALVFLPGLVAAGAFLATAFAYREAWIGQLYAADLVAAALACLLSIGLMRVVQGPAALLVPALLGAMASLVLKPTAGRTRVVAVILTGITLGGTINGVISDGNSLDVHGAAEARLVFERWNEHSRVVVVKKPASHYIIIDRSAGTYLAKTDLRKPGDPIPVKPEWDRSVRHIAYRLGRPLRRAAIIGAGGGQDLLAPLKNGAKRVDGYELNGILIDLLQQRFAGENNIATWPEVSLIHNEARVGIAHAGTTYDVIQASMIDTWASTASGGFVLSENGIYTVEGWSTFLAALSERGVLTMTRWYLPQVPAETQRLVSLAVLSLQRAGIPRARGHIVLVGAGPVPGAGRPVMPVRRATILVSKAPFNAAEVQRLRQIVAREGMHLIAAPGQPARDPVVDQLLDPDRYLQTIAQSPFDLSVPTDQRPYFFLQVRPRDVPKLFGKKLGFLLELTFNAVGVMVLLGAIALLFALVVLLLGLFTLPSAAATPSQRRVYRWMTLYFMGIGLGYILIQLGLHQCFILVLGHPTYALSVVLFSMLLGTGLGAFASRRLFPRGRFLHGWLAIIAVLIVTVLSIPAVSWLEQLHWAAGRAVVVGALVAVVGFFLGFAFPLGVRLVAVTGEWAVQKMWAINGAASIAGATLAAILGLGLGSRAVLIVGLVCYVVIALCGYQAQRSSGDAGRPTT